jgi:phospholipase A-2-activating protein
MNAVTYLAPTSTYSQGLIISGGKDSIIDVREPGKPPDANAERLLLGHEHNICALDVSPDLKWIVSGSWDATARIWTVDDWNCATILEGHQGSVWSVLAYDSDTIITGNGYRALLAECPANWYT